MQMSDALHRCRRIDMVDYEADLLLARARLHHTKGERQQAKEDAIEALVIANRSDFRVLRADISNLLARLDWEDGDYIAAIDFARSALNDALCDGPPYCYKPALAEAKHLLQVIKPDSLNKNVTVRCRTRHSLLILGMTPNNLFFPGRLWRRKKKIREFQRVSAVKEKE